MLKNTLLIASSVYSFVLATLSLIEVKDKLPSIQNGDKFYHATAYFVFMILLYYTFYLTFELKNSKALLIAFITSISFGIVIELLQGLLTQNRQSDINDVIANVIGAILALFLLKNNKKKDIN